MAKNPGRRRWRITQLKAKSKPPNKILPPTKTVPCHTHHPHTHEVPYERIPIQWTRLPSDHISPCAVCRLMLGPGMIYYIVLPIAHLRQLPSHKFEKWSYIEAWHTPILVFLFNSSSFVLTRICGMIKKNLLVKPYLSISPSPSTSPSDVHFALPITSQLLAF